MKLRHFTIEKLGPKRERTPEGYLVCLDVPIARTGIQTYHERELANDDGTLMIQGNADGLVTVNRYPEEVFTDEAIASVNGKDVVIGHPAELIDPSSWRALTVGTVTNPRRGTGADSDVLLADLVLKDDEAIDKVLNDELPEVSCGYKCDYLQTAPATAMQKNIRINHVALVERGRCGVRCEIGDSVPGGERMKFTDWVKSLMEKNKAKDCDGVKALLDHPPTVVTRDDDEGGHEPEPAGVHLHMHGAPGAEGAAGAKDDRKWTDEKLDEKFGAIEKTMGDHHKAIMDSLEELKKGKEKEETDDKEIEGALREEVPEGAAGDDCISRAHDSALLENRFQETRSMAEIIAPGIPLPTFDTAVPIKRTFLNLCKFRVKALLAGQSSDPAVRGYIDEILGGKTFDEAGSKKMACDQVRTLFYAVAARKRSANTQDFRPAPAAIAGTRTNEPNQVHSIADLNKRNSEFYAAAK